ncbi:NADH:flavorubredoxin reductase NorW [Hafnia paralvei]|uniref:NADH:flavorubredoxin reductase NorW n=1 Tax=Hafnia paralvei TaxID=546367 RepID=UPI0037BEFEF4
MIFTLQIKDNMMADNHPLIIVGSGHAGLQLARNVRRLQASSGLVMICADDGVDYSKPQLSHAFSQQQTAQHLTRKTAEELRQELKMMLLNGQRIEAIHPNQRTVQVNGRTLAYSKLVLATGARAFIPPVAGDANEEILTLNSLQEYLYLRERMAYGERVLVIGGGLIGTEIAHDLAVAGKRVSVCDPSPYLLASLLPEFAAQRLSTVLRDLSCELMLNNTLEMLQRLPQGVRATFTRGEVREFDHVICAAGLRPNIELAAQAGLNVERGIVVDNQLRTSDSYIYALGDVAQIEGRLWPFLQPISQSAAALAKTLSGEPTHVSLPIMPINVKTPRFPIQLAGETCADDVTWQTEEMPDGLLAKGYRNDKLVAYIAGGSAQMQGLTLLRQLSM